MKSLNLNIKGCFPCLNMKRSHGIKLIAGLLLLSGCTKNFEKINTDPTRLLTLSSTDLRSLFPGSIVQTFVGTSYWASSLGPGLFSRQFASTQVAHSFQRYLIPDFMPATIYNAWYGALSPLQNIIDATRDNAPTLNAVARIWKVFILHRATDTWGPIIYSQIGSPGKVLTFDSQKDVYYDFFKELESADSLLKNNLNTPSFGDKDPIYQGNNSEWRKFGNTLRLRLAMRISMVDSAKAKMEAEKAVSNGVMTDLSDNAFVAVSVANPNGMNFQTGWNEQRMSCEFESLFKGWNDPRMSKYWSPALTDGQYRGVRCGMTPAQQVIPENSYDNTSNVSLYLQPVNMNTTPQTVMYSAEAYFARAEGALNGWDMGGTAQELYQKGIESSMNTWGITDPTVINTYINGTSLPVALNDYYHTPALTDIPVKFSNDPQKEREQIGTQKWIAEFPQPHETWAEVRRSGYPKTYPLLNSDNPNVPTTEMIPRMLYPIAEHDNNLAGYQTAVQELGAGGNLESTHLWWDVH